MVIERKQIEQIVADCKKTMEKAPPGDNFRLSRRTLGVLLTLSEIALRQDADPGSLAEAEAARQELNYLEKLLNLFPT